jgi:hypothetical protein
MLMWTPSSRKSTRRCAHACMWRAIDGHSRASCERGVGARAVAPILFHRGWHRACPCMPRHPIAHSHPRPPSRLSAPPTYAPARRRRRRWRRRTLPTRRLSRCCCRRRHRARACCTCKDALSRALQRPATPLPFAPSCITMPLSRAPSLSPPPCRPLPVAPACAALARARAASRLSSSR